MNFFTATLTKKQNGLWAEFGKEAIKIPDGKANKAELAPYIGKEVILGIRPEEIHDEESFLSINPDATVSAYVEVTEMMGAETYLYLTINGVQFTARVSQRSTAKTDDTIKVGFDVNHLHFFDKDTELAILN